MREPRSLRPMGGGPKSALVPSRLLGLATPTFVGAQRRDACEENRLVEGGTDRLRLARPARTGGTPCLGNERGVVLVPEPVVEPFLLFVLL